MSLNEGGVSLSATNDTTVKIHTEALICDGMVPQVDAKVVCGEIVFSVAVYGDGVDVVCMAV